MNSNNLTSWYERVKYSFLNTLHVPLEELNLSSSQEEAEGFGKLYPSTQPSQQQDQHSDDEQDLPSDVISRKELEKGRLSRDGKQTNTFLNRTVNEEVINYQRLFSPYLKKWILVSGKWPCGQVREVLTITNNHPAIFSCKKVFCFGSVHCTLRLNSSDDNKLGKKKNTFAFHVLNSNNCLPPLHKSCSVLQEDWKQQEWFVWNAY